MGLWVQKYLRNFAALCAIACFAAPLSATLVYSDGASHFVTGVTADNISVGSATSVQFTNGSAQPGQTSADLFSIEATGGSLLTSTNYSVAPNSTAGVARGYQIIDSTLNMTNGSVSGTGYVGAEGISGFGTSTINVIGGSVAAQLQADQNGAFSAGSYAYGVSANDSSRITLTSGTYSVHNTGGDFAIAVAGYGTSRITIRAGTFTASGSTANYALAASGQSTIDLYGGTLSASGDTEIVAFGTSTINVYGSAFFVDGIAVPFGTLSATSGLLTGKLENGDKLGGDNFYRDGTATINLVAGAVPVPEPMGVCLLAAWGWRLLAGRRRGR